MLHRWRFAWLYRALWFLAWAVGIGLVLYGLCPRPRRVNRMVLTNLVIVRILVSFQYACAGRNDFPGDFFAEILRNGHAWGENGFNEACYDLLVNAKQVCSPPPDFYADTDSDGRPEFVDGWGEPLAVLWGDIGRGAVYLLKDGRRARLLKAQFLGDRVPLGDEAILLSDLGHDLFCRWDLGHTVLSIRYYGKHLFVRPGYMPHAIVTPDGEPLLFFPILADEDVGGYIASITEERGADAGSSD